MPQYYLDVHDDYKTWCGLDAFTQGYVEALFFTNCSSADDGELEGMTFADLSQTALVTIMAECEAFQEENRTALDVAYEHGGERGDYDDAAAGRDFWYTRCGHGVGFWDRGLGILGDELTSQCGFGTKYPNRDVYRGDDGMVHLS